MFFSSLIKKLSISAIPPSAPSPLFSFIFFISSRRVQIEFIKEVCYTGAEKGGGRMANILIVETAPSCAG
jgi:hypothetical protein